MVLCLLTFIRHSFPIPVEFWTATVIEKTRHDNRYPPVIWHSNGKWTRIEDVSPIKNGGFPASYVSLPEGTCMFILWQGAQENPILQFTFFNIGSFNGCTYSLAEVGIDVGICSTGRFESEEIFGRSSSQQWLMAIVVTPQKWTCPLKPGLVFHPQSETIIHNICQCHSRCRKMRWSCYNVLLSQIAWVSAHWFGEPDDSSVIWPQLHSSNVLQDSPT